MEPIKNLGMALWDLTDILAECPAETGGNIWGRLVRHCKRGTVDHRYVTPVEQQIRQYIAGLSDTDKREIWSQTETGEMSRADPSSSMIEDIEMDLENELLGEVLEQAFIEAEGINQKRRRKSRSS